MARRRRVAPATDRAGLTRQTVRRSRYGDGQPRQTSTGRQEDCDEDTRPGDGRDPLVLGSRQRRRGRGWRQGREPGRADPCRVPGARRVRRDGTGVPGGDGQHRGSRPSPRPRGRHRRRGPGGTRRGVGRTADDGPLGGRARRPAADHHRQLRAARRPRRSRRALVGDRRGHRRHVVRRHERDVHQCGGRRCADRPDRRLLGVRLRPAGRRLPGPPRCPRRARDRRVRPADGRQRAVGCGVHRRPGHRRSLARGDRGRVRLGRGGRQRRRATRHLHAGQGRPTAAVGQHRRTGVPDHPWRRRCRQAADDERARRAATGADRRRSGRPRQDRAPRRGALAHRRTSSGRSTQARSSSCRHAPSPRCRRP